MEQLDFEVVAVFLKMQHNSRVGDAVAVTQAIPSPSNYHIYIEKEVPARVTSITSLRHPGVLSCFVQPCATFVSRSRQCEFVSSLPHQPPFEKYFFPLVMSLFFYSTISLFFSWNMTHSSITLTLTFFFLLFFLEIKKVHPARRQDGAARQGKARRGYRPRRWILIRVDGRGGEGEAGSGKEGDGPESVGELTDAIATAGGGGGFRCVGRKAPERDTGLPFEVLRLSWFVFHYVLF